VQRVLSDQRRDEDEHGDAAGKSAGGRASANSPPRHMAMNGSGVVIKPATLSPIIATTIPAPDPDGTNEFRSPAEVRAPG